MHESADPVNWDKVDQIIDEITLLQQTKLLECGRRIIPRLTPEDVLQPNDYPQLESHPIFRYEEGIFAGIHTIKMALLAYRKSRS